MAYNTTGTAGNDTLNHRPPAVPAPSSGLAGDDCIFTGSGPRHRHRRFRQRHRHPADRQHRNGQRRQRERQHLRRGRRRGSMLLLGGDGADTIDMSGATAGADHRRRQRFERRRRFHHAAARRTTSCSATAATTRSRRTAATTRSIGGFGNDSHLDAGGTIDDSCSATRATIRSSSTAGNDTVFGGLGNDSRSSITPAGDARSYFGNEGADTIDAAPTAPSTIVGGNDSADGSDSILERRRRRLHLRQRRRRHDRRRATAPTRWSAASATTRSHAGAGADLIFANESNDTVDCRRRRQHRVRRPRQRLDHAGGAGRDTYPGQRGERHDPRRRRHRHDLGRQRQRRVRLLATPDEDGNNAAGGGPVELITDVNWAEDRFDTVDRR